MGLLAWTKLTTPQTFDGMASSDAHFRIEPAVWGAATTGPEDDALPSCLSAPSYRSMWYSVTVPESAVLRVIVKPDDASVYQPVVTILDTSLQELGCGLGGTDPRSDPNATATAYVSGEGNPGTMYLIRIAQVVPHAPTAATNQGVSVDVSGRDLTPPHINVKSEHLVGAPRSKITYDATQSTDFGAGLDKSSAVFSFSDGGGNPLTKGGKLSVWHRWHTSGVHKVAFSIRDFAGNQSTYVWFVYIHDFTPPRVALGVDIPRPASRRMFLVVRHSESVQVRLLVTQGLSGPPLWRGTLFLGGNRRSGARLKLRRHVASHVPLIVSGVARDGAGNTTLLPSCTLVASPVGGSCWRP